MLTDYHFRLFETRAGLRLCLKHSGVAHRLWKAFVLNGYIAEKMEFPRDEVSCGGVGVGGWGSGRVVESVGGRFVWG